MQTFIFLISAFLIITTANAKELEKRMFEDSMVFEGQTLPLRGLGLRKVQKFGIPVKVYVAGLYIDAAKATTADQVVQSANPKIVQLQMLRRISKKDIADAFSESHDANCAPTCDKSRPHWNEFAKLLPDLLEDSKLTFTVLKDELRVDVKGRENTQGVIKSPEFSQNFLKIFMGPKPPTEQLQQGMLGQ